MKLPIGEIGSYKTGGGKTRWRLQYDEDHIYGYDTEAEAKAAQKKFFAGEEVINPFIKEVIPYKGVNIERTAADYYVIPGYASRNIESVRERIDAGLLKGTPAFETRNDIGLGADPEDVTTYGSGSASTTNAPLSTEAGSILLLAMVIGFAISIIWFIMRGN